MKQLKNNLFAIHRKSFGKGIARKLRKKNQTPVALHLNPKTIIMLSVNTKEITTILNQTHKRNILIYLSIQGYQSKLPIMIHDLQIHKTKRIIEHIDFNLIDLNKNIKRQIPLILTGKSEMVTRGGKLIQTKKIINIIVNPKDIPNQIYFDITNIKFGFTKIRNIISPNHLIINEDLENIILTVKKPQKKETGDIIKSD